MPSERILAEVEAQVRVAPPGGGETPAEIHKRMDCWSRVTVRVALSELAQVGRIVYEGTDQRRLYRREPT